MTALRLFARPFATRLLAWRAPLLAAGLGALLAACGGGSADAPPPPETGPVVVGVPPTITQQPASISVTAGQPASFTVAASGDAPIAYQWQRNGVAIAGATATTYTLTTTALADSGATFRAIATNAAGSATSNSATLTVTAATPVLTITPQPANVSVTAGTSASFTVGGTCSSGTLAIQWQRNNGTGGAFANIAGATATTYTLSSPAAGDSGAQFRAVLDCSGQSSAASSVATLTVTAPVTLTLSIFPTVGLREQANIGFAYAVDQQSDGSWVLSIGNGLSRLAPDLLSLTSFAGGTTGPVTDGVGAAAVFARVSGVTHDSAGNLYVTDALGSHTIRKVTPGGTVTTIAGALGQLGYADGTGSAARFSSPSGIVTGPDGDLYVSDPGNRIIRRVTTSGVVTTYAGVQASFGSDFLDGPAATAKFSFPAGLVVAPNGDLYVADAGNDRIRKIARSGNGAGLVTTFAGGNNLVATGADGVGIAANIPQPLALLLRGNTLYVADGQNMIRQIDLTTAAVTHFSGSPSPAGSYADGPAAKATFAIGSNSGGMAPGPGGGLVIADYRAVRVADAAGAVTTIASIAGRGTGVLVQRPLSPEAVSLDTQGRIVLSENGIACSVRRIDISGNVTQVAGLPGSCSVIDGKASNAQFSSSAIKVAAAPDGSVWVADNTVVRRIATDNTVTTIAGVAGQSGAADGTGSAARFTFLSGVATSPAGDAYVADTLNAAVRRVTATGIVTTAVGALGQSAADDGAIATARLSRPSALAFAPDGSLWIVDGVSAVLRRVSPDGQTVSTPTGAPNRISSLAFGADGTAYLIVNASGGGLFAYNPTTATSTLLIPYTGILNLGSTGPTLRTESSIAVLGPKQIVIADPGLHLLLVTLP